MNNPQRITHTQHNISSWQIIPEWTMVFLGNKEDKMRAVMSNRPKTIAFDLDGVLAQYNGWNGADTLIGEPVSGMRELLSSLRDKGVKIIIFTCRGAHDTKLWADRHDIPYDWININGDDYYQNIGKPLADIYVDDRAICFKGDVDQLARDIDSFQPYSYNKEK
jgi:hypothetical protein